MKKLALAAAATLIALVVAEGALRVTGLGRIRPEIQFGEIIGSRLESEFFIFDEDLFWREPSGPPDPVHLGTHFVRVGDAVGPKDRRMRILCLGDSCTRLSRTNRPYSVRLQEALGPRAEVFNASLPGYTSHQGLAWLERQLLELRPDVVIVYFGWNDHWRSWGLSDRAYARTLRASSLRLLNLISPKPSPPDFRLSPDEYRENLESMARRIATAGGKMIVVLAPHNINDENSAHYRENGIIVEGDDPLELHQSYLEIARELSGMPGVRVVDAAGRFAGIGELELTLQRDGIHPTDPGHQVLARALADDIVTHDMGARLPPGDPVAAGLSVVAQELGFTGEWAAAVRLFRSSIEREPEGVVQRLGLAWLLSTCPDGNYRDGTEALAILAPVEPAAGSTARFLDVQAAALAETGRYDEAAATLDRALAVLTERGGAGSEFARTMDMRRDLHRAGKPYRTPPPPEPTP